MTDENPREGVRDDYPLFYQLNHGMIQKSPCIHKCKPKGKEKPRGRNYGVYYYLNHEEEWVRLSCYVEEGRSIDKYLIA